MARNAKPRRVGGHSSTESRSGTKAPPIQVETRKDSKMKTTINLCLTFKTETTKKEIIEALIANFQEFERTGRTFCVTDKKEELAIDDFKILG